MAIYFENKIDLDNFFIILNDINNDIKNCTDMLSESRLEINKIIVIASGIEKEKQIKNIIEDNSTVLNPLSFLFNNTNGSYFLSDMNVDI